MNEWVNEKKSGFPKSFKKLEANFFAENFCAACYCYIALN